MIDAATTADAAANDPAYLPARSGLYLNDRQLAALFERVCDDAGVGTWTCATGPHFDVTAEDIRTEIRKLHRVATSDMDLRHALRIIAWTWERECITT